MTSLMSGCLAGQVIVGGLSASSSYFSYKASNLTFYSAECTTEMFIPDEDYQSRWTERERSELLAQIRFYQRECGQ